MKGAKSENVNKSGNKLAITTLYHDNLFVWYSSGMQRVLILHNVRSTYNVGSIFRTAEAASVSKIYLTGYTPAPTDRFGRARKDIHKTALGAEKMIPWEHVPRIGTLLARLKKEKYYIIGVEQSKRSVDYRTVRIKQKTALIFGNEVRGLSLVILKQCDVVAEIGMKGSMVRHAHHPRHLRRGKESLNVSVSAGIVLFHFIN